MTIREPRHEFIRDTPSRAPHTYTHAAKPYSAAFNGKPTAPIIPLRQAALPIPWHLTSHRLQSHSGSTFIHCNMVDKCCCPAGEPWVPLATRCDSHLPLRPDSLSQPHGLQPLPLSSLSPDRQPLENRFRCDLSTVPIGANNITSTPNPRGKAIRFRSPPHPTKPKPLSWQSACSSLSTMMMLPHHSHCTLLLPPQLGSQKGRRYGTLNTFLSLLCIYRENPVSNSSFIIDCFSWSLDPVSANHFRSSCSDVSHGGSERNGRLTFVISTAIPIYPCHFRWELLRAGRACPTSWAASAVLMSCWRAGPGSHPGCAGRGAGARDRLGG